MLLKISATALLLIITAYLLSCNQPEKKTKNTVETAGSSAAAIPSSKPPFAGQSYFFAPEFDSIDVVQQAFAIAVRGTSISLILFLS